MTDRITKQEYLREAKKACRKVEDYKKMFLDQLHLLGLPQPETELVFAPPRRWRLDFCWPDLAIAVEYQGGTFYGVSGHSNVVGQMRDCEKFTEAALRGWLLILINSASVRSGQAVEWVERAFKQRGIAHSMLVSGGVVQLEGVK